MTEKLKQQLNEEILKLPKENQDAINSFDWVKTIEEIGKKFLLEEDELNTLELETGLVLVGIIVDLDLYKANIEYNTGISSKDAEDLTREVFDKIFIPIGNKIELAIKNKMLPQNAEWNKTINFIISGGDYSFFMNNK